MPLLAAIASLVWPVLGLVISKVQFIIIEMSYTHSAASYHQRNVWFLIFLFICLGIGILVFLEKLIFGVSGENLTGSVRKLLFRGIIYKQVCWFDDELKAPGVLTTVLQKM